MGANATAEKLDSLPSPRHASSRPSLGSHSRAVPSAEAVATHAPSGLNAQSATPPPLCARHEEILARFATSHTRTHPWESHVTSRRSSGEKDAPRETTTPRFGFALATLAPPNIAPRHVAAVVSQRVTAPSPAPVDARTDPLLACAHPVVRSFAPGSSLHLRICPVCSPVAASKVRTAGPHAANTLPSSGLQHAPATGAPHSITADGPFRVFGSRHTQHRPSPPAVTMASDPEGDHASAATPPALAS